MSPSLRAERRTRLLATLVSSVVVLLVLLAGPAAAQEDGPGDAAVPTTTAVVPDATADDGIAPLPATPELPATGPSAPDVSISIGGDDAALSRTVLVVLLLTVGSVAPAVLLLTTTFTRFVVVLAIAKNALGLQTVPPAQVLVGLSLFLSMFSMQPVFSQINQDAVQPFLAGDLPQGDALGAAIDPLRDFMLSQTRESDLEMFVGLAGEGEVANSDDIATTTLLPAFVISELRTAFSIGVVVLIPFLVLDLVVAAILMALGMVMLPPVFVSLPLKLLLFVLVDGWALIASSLVNSVQPGVIG